jgi:cystathionine beta-lyase/cystathionine gamma-synthase
MKIATKLLHAGEIEESLNSIITPVYRTSTYKLNEDVYSLIKRHAGTENPERKISESELLELRRKFFYVRSSNPNSVVVQRKMAMIEGCDDCVTAASGMGAISATILSVIEGKRYIVSTPHLYGAAFSLIFEELRKMFGITVIQLEEFLSGKWMGSVKDREIAAVYVETLSNPFLRIAPLDEIIKVRNECCRDVPVIVDNTFLTPMNIRLFDVMDPGRDIVLYSATKYLSGHSDLIGGIVCGSVSRINRVWEKVTRYGCCMDAETAYNLEKGLKTLHVRMERHNSNLIEIVEYLTGVSKKYNLRLFHPLTGEYALPGFARALVDRRRLGGMVTFSVENKGEKDGIRFMDILHDKGVIKHATSLGGVESLISMPYNTSQPSPVQQEMLGMRNFRCLLRLSVGLEDIEDIRNSLDAAFEEMNKGGN